jgi:hypothetical protein
MTAVDQKRGRTGRCGRAVAAVIGEGGGIEKVSDGLVDNKKV